MAHALFQNLHRPPLQRLRAETDRSMNQLHVLEAELLEQFVEFHQRFGDHVCVTVRVLRVVNLLDREPVLVQVVLLE